MHALAQPTSRREYAQLLLPRLSLSHCVQAVLLRDTRGLQLDDQQRRSYFPCTPMCSITWIFDGQVELFELPPGGPQEGPRRPMPAELVFAGPWTRPVASWSAGPVHLMKLMLRPDALQALTGVAPSDWVNRVAPVREVLDERWWQLCREVREAADDDARIALLQARLDAWWQAARPERSAGVYRIEDWSQGLALRAATSALGRSVRQIERRIKQWTGQPLRELRGMGRSERAFFEAVLAVQEADWSWADVAERAGYADQSHLCRQTRRVTGFAPEELRRRMDDESFWAYRIWGMAALQPPWRQRQP